MEVKVLYVQRDLQYEISSYWRFSVEQFHTNLNRTRDIYICMKYRYKPHFNKYYHKRELL
jgi:hypothetical protein